MSFNVVVADPCRTTAITTVDVTSGLSLKLGETATKDFLEAVTAVETSTSLPAICGAKSYSVIDPSDSNNVVSWISIAAKSGSAGTYTITASPIDETFVKANNYQLKTILDDYAIAHSHAGRTDAFVVTIAAADCDCSGVVRTHPSLVTHTGAVADGGTSINIPPAVIDETASKLLGPKIRACYPSNSCANTATYVVKNSDNSSLPSWLVNTGSAVTVTPLNGDAVGDHTLRIVMTPTNGAVQTYDMLKIVVTCTIASINDVAAPNSGLSYTLYDK